MSDPYVVSRLHDELRELKDENRNLKHDLEVLSKKYWLLISQFREHLEQDAKEKH